MAHSHNHQDENLKVAFFLNFGFTIIELIGGYLTNSISIIADSLHDLGDSISLAISWRFEKLAHKEGDNKYSYGYRRFSLLSALISALVLIVGMIFIGIEAVERVMHPEPVNAQGMLILSFLGIAANGFAAYRAGKGKNLNSQIIYWHLLEDALGWGAVMIVSIVLFFRDIYILDPLLSIVVSVFILFNVIKNLIKTINLFLQGVPDSIQIDKIEAQVRTDANVTGVHHTHIWSMDGEHHVLTTHIVLNERSKKEDIRRIKNLVRDISDEFNISHSTIEFEYVDEDCSMNHSHEEVHVGQT
jgi:cobalt-zinc-cadmium efflux system protein